MEVQVLFVGRDMDFEHVANIDLSGYEFDNMSVEDALEYAYRVTQNIEGSWSMGKTIKGWTDGYVDNPDYNPYITVLKPLYKNPNTGEEWGHRSSMMGDRMIVDGKIYEVDFIGFKLISEVE